METTPGRSLWARISSWPRTPSFRARMTVSFAAVIAVILLTCGILLSRQTRRSAEKRAHELLARATRQSRLEQLELDNLHRSLAQMARVELSELTVDGVRLLVVDGNGKILLRSHHDAPEWPPRRSTRRAWRFSSYTSGNQRIIFALEFASINEELRERETLIALFGILILCASTAGAWLVVGRTLSPIDDLSDQAKNASIERLKVRLSAPSRDAEIVNLVETLNGLLERLEKESKARERFYAAASHELRTPLQSLIGELDVILDRPREAADYREALEIVRGESLQLTGLVQALLQLNQLEMIAPPPSTRLDVADVIDRTLQHYREPISKKQLIIERELPDAEIVAPPAHVEMLIRNMTDNAVSYAPEESTIRISLRRAEDHVRLQISNAAQVHSGQDISSWFEPFFRPDAARTSGSGGNGLGLAICRAIAQTDGWKLELRAEDKRVCACIVWPKFAKADDTTI